MRIEKKLIACSVLIFTIGICSITPLLFIMPKAAKADTATSQPWFNINVPYAYVDTSNGTFDLSSARLENGTIITASGERIDVPQGQNVTKVPSVNEAYAFILNFTANPAAKDDVTDARFEYYQLTIYSDQGQIANMTYFIGGGDSSNLDSSGRFHFTRDDWFDSNTTCGGTFSTNSSALRSGTAQVSAITGSNSGIIGDNSLSSLVTALRQAQTIYVDVYRLGWVTLNGNTTIVTHASNTVLQHLQLNRYGNEGFLCNNLFTPDELSQIDLSSPMQSLPPKT